MKMTRNPIKFTFTLLTVVLLTNSCGILKKTPTHESIASKTETAVFPKSTGYVNDFENILTAKEERELTKIIKDHELKTTDQIAIVTLTSLVPYENIEDYSFNLANYWEVGQKDKNNGILIALGKDLKEIRIENGVGIEKRLSDVETKRIIDEIMIPEFRADNYFAGLKKGIEVIVEELE